MPVLHTHNVDRLPASLENNESKKKELGSQGFFAEDSYAYSHTTSVPLSYFLNEMGLPYEVNMDRGGIKSRSDGSQAACIADGLGGETYFSAFVAHMICEYFLSTFSEKPMDFTENGETNKAIAQELLQECANHIKARCPNTCWGASTALFAECVPAEKRDGKQMYTLQAISLGDAAVIHINTTSRMVSQLNKIQRFNNMVTDTGGSIFSTGDIEQKENITAVTTKVAKNDYIVLVTDGFLDNVRDEKVEEIILFVAFNPFFDTNLDNLVNYDRCWEWRSEGAALPTLREIKEFVQNNGGSLDMIYPRPTPAQVTQRLANYTNLVTYTRSKKEEQYYCKQQKNSLQTNRPISLPKTSTAGASENQPDNSPKTDDCMIITFSPSNI